MKIRIFTLSTCGNECCDYCILLATFLVVRKTEKIFMFYFLFFLHFTSELWYDVRVALYKRSLLERFVKECGKVLLYKVLSIERIFF